MEQTLAVEPLALQAIARLISRDSAIPLEGFAIAPPFQNTAVTIGIDKLLIFARFSGF
jgi:hypothetical protein